MDRREFLVLSGACVASGCAILSGGASHRSWAAPPKSFVGETLEIPLPEVQALGDKDALLVQLGKNQPDLLVVKRPDGFAVVTADCTHQGCTVGWAAAQSEWHCPCHGSRFAFDGKVLEGPAEDPLQRPTARVEGDRLIVDLAGLS